MRSFLNDVLLLGEELEVESFDLHTNNTETQPNHAFLHSLLTNPVTEHQANHGNNVFIKEGHTCPEREISAKVKGSQSRNKVKV